MMLVGYYFLVCKAEVKVFFIYRSDALFGF